MAVIFLGVGREYPVITVDAAMRIDLSILRSVVEVALLPKAHGVLARMVRRIIVGAIAGGRFIRRFWSMSRGTAGGFEIPQMRSHWLARNDCPISAEQARQFR
jgi:hypothetical protein